MDLLSMMPGGGFVTLGVIISRYVKHRGSGHDAPTHSLCSCGHAATARTWTARNAEL